MLEAFKAMLAIIISMIMTFSANVTGKKIIDTEDYTLVWSDEFEEDTLNSDNWDCIWEGVRRGCRYDDNQCFTEDGCLVLRTLYRDGSFYSGAVESKKTFCGGYFEVRCILPESTGLWAAFWLLCDGVTNVDGTGRDGAEIDIFESAYAFEKIPTKKWVVSSAVHFDGYGEDIQSKGICSAFVPINPYKNFNTYGLEWTDEEYIFYVNGIEIGRTDFGGTSQVEESMILSVEVGGANGVPEDSWAGGALTDTSICEDFVIDYVRVYQ